MSKLTSILAVCRLEEEEGSETAWGCFRRCQRRIRENEDLTIKGPALEATPEQGRGARGGAWAALHPGGSRTCSWSSGVLRTGWPSFILAFITETLILCWSSRDGGTTVHVHVVKPLPTTSLCGL